MKQSAVFILSLLLCIGCNSSIEKPSHLLSENTMVEILTDVYLHKQQSYLVETQANALDLSKLDAQIIQKHGASTEEFKESFHYYVLHPEIYSKILTTVRDKLEAKLPEAERVKRVSERKTKDKKEIN